MSSEEPIKINIMYRCPELQLMQARNIKTHINVTKVHFTVECACGKTHTLIIEE